jgi:hypothetical protein
VVVLLLAGYGFPRVSLFHPAGFSRPRRRSFRKRCRVAPPANDIADPLQRAMAERGREIVVRTGCIGCHA